MPPPAHSSGRRDSGQRRPHLGMERGRGGRAASKEEGKMREGNEKEERRNEARNYNEFDL